ncbi:Uncharacterised protein [Serratia quinivorans]|nr:Uncharacterised protein [Serratia quinivorans]
MARNPTDFCLIPHFIVVEFVNSLMFNVFYLVNFWGESISWAVPQP